ncbi:MAG: ATP-binding cassette domain-containing protein, partial [Solirubrobacterales bacterium]|nr:ATP-binding cassette domain-containing protein [Solirubrobacterales bacterium]
LVGELLLLEGVCKGYWRGQSYLGVLRDVSLEVERGQIVAVIAPRLGGKTTLLQIAAGMEMSDSGSVSVGGRALSAGRQRRTWRGWRLRRERPDVPVLGRDVMWVNRDGPHQELEVSKYVGSPLAVHAGRQRDRDVRLLAGRALERVGAQDCVGRRWGELSNWQRVLVGLARAFAGSPQLVIIDDLLDALGGPDTDMASDLLRSLVEDSEPRCGVLLSAGYFDSAVVLADEVWALRRETLRRRAGRPVGTHDDRDDVIIPFPKPAENQGSRGAGSA